MANLPQWVGKDAGNQEKNPIFSYLSVNELYYRNGSTPKPFPRMPFLVRCSPETSSDMSGEKSA